MKSISSPVNKAIIIFCSKLYFLNCWAICKTAVTPLALSLAPLYIESLAICEVVSMESDFSASFLSSSVDIPR